MNYIMRPVYNRPEMLQLSLEYEAIARDYHQFSSDLTTLFIVEYGATKEVIDLVRNYPFQYQAIFRDQRQGLSANMLEGMKVAFDNSDDFIIVIEDDVLLHKTYFKYMDAVMSCKDIGTWSVLSAWNHTDSDDPSTIRKAHHYASLAPIMHKWFHSKYVRPISNSKYYNDPHGLVCYLDNLYKDFTSDNRYKFKQPVQHQQAGVINRMVDIASIEDNAWVITPGINRQQHIGFYGHNRPGGCIPGDTYEKRMSNLREIIRDKDKLYAATGSKQYNDYVIFSDKLEDWDGTVRLV